MIRSALVVLAALSLTLGGCAQRATHMIEASGDRALEKENYTLAAAEYAQVVDRLPHKARARLQYGKALLGIGEADRAREQLEKAYTLLPNDDEVITTLAEAMAQSRSIEEAARLLRTIAQDRKRPADYLRLGQFLQRANDADAAEEALLAAARGDRGQSVEMQMALVQLYRSIGSDEKALARLRMAYYLDPIDPRIQELIRGYGEVPGPTFAQVPSEQD